jgi:hypothetical protein
MIVSEAPFISRLPEQLGMLVFLITTLSITVSGMCSLRWSIDL